MFNNKYIEQALSRHAHEAATIGFVARTRHGQVLIVEPSGHFDGVTRTVPKVQVAKGEHPATALRRCVASKLGTVDVESLMPVPGNWSSSKGKTVYFTGVVPAKDLLPDGKLVQRVHELSVGEAVAALAASPNLSSRTRDISILQAASDVEVVPHRVVMKALACLHARGFQRLRAEYWHNGIAPRLNWSPSLRQGSMSATLLQRELDRANIDVHLKSHSLASGQVYFNIFFDSVFDTPEQLAQRWLERAPALAWAGFGEDPDYSAWYRDALAATGPAEYFYWSQSEEPNLVSSSGGSLRLPPPTSSV